MPWTRLPSGASQAESAVRARLRSSSAGDPLEERITMKAVVRDVMTTDPVSARKTSSFKELAARLLEFRVSAFPVLDDDGKVIGVVSEADMLAKESLDGGRDATRGMITRILHRKELKKAGGTKGGDRITRTAAASRPAANR